MLFKSYIWAYMVILTISTIYKVITLWINQEGIDAFADLLINYQGGFIRRGLLGTLLLMGYKICHVSPIHIAIVLSLVSYLCLLTFCLTKLKTYHYGFSFLTPCFLFGGIGIYGIGYMRRDYIILFAFLLMVMLWKNRGITKSWLYLSLAICMATIICYEPYFFVCLPFFILLSLMKYNNRSLTAFASLILLLTFLVCSKFQGTVLARNCIWESVNSFLPEMGTIDFIGRNGIEVMKFQAYNNFIRTEHHIPCVFVSMISIFCMTYYIVNGLYIFNKRQVLFNDRKAMLLYLCSSYIFQLPMFVCLSTDYSRICTYSAIASIIMYVTIDSNQLINIVPQKIDKILSQTIITSDKYMKPTKKKIIVIMTAVGIAEWTGGGIGQFAYSSEIGFIIKLCKNILFSI